MSDYCIYGFGIDVTNIDLQILEVYISNKYPILLSTYKDLLENKGHNYDISEDLIYFLVNYLKFPLFDYSEAKKIDTLYPEVYLVISSEENPDPFELIKKYNSDKNYYIEILELLNQTIDNKPLLYPIRMIY
jgi:hypothetical protein